MMKTVPNSVLLASLAADDFHWLKPHLELVELPRGMVLAEAGESLQHTDFPHSAVVSLIKDMQGGQATEMASFGREALIGLSFENAPLLSFGRSIVQVPGVASRMDRNRVQDAMAARPGVERMILRYTEILWVLTLQNVAYNASHSVEARCSRWIVATHDRLDRDDLPLTHEALADALGVQRSTVSEILRSLQRRGLIRRSGEASRFSTVPAFRRRRVVNGCAATAIRKSYGGKWVMLD